MIRERLILFKNFVHVYEIKPVMNVLFDVCHLRR
jgi:hypothetical protein